MFPTKPEILLVVRLAILTLEAMPHDDPLPLHSFFPPMFLNFRATQGLWASQQVRRITGAVCQTVA